MAQCSPCRIMIGTGLTPLLCHSGQQWCFLFVLESWLQLEPFLRAFTSKAGMGILLFRAVPESDFAQSRTRTSFAGVHGKGLQRVCLFVSSFTARLCRYELALSAHSSKSPGRANPVPTPLSPGPAALQFSPPHPFPLACPGAPTSG